MTTATVGPGVGQVRVQRQRTKGWRMPPGAVYVGRPSPWGNPWAVDDQELLGHPQPDGSPWTLDDTLRWFRQYARDILATTPDWLEALRGKTLVCWCPLDQPCHADVLLELAASHG